MIASVTSITSRPTADQHDQSNVSAQRRLLVLHLSPLLVSRSFYHPLSMAMPNQRMLPFEGHIAEIILAADYVSPRLANTGNRFFQSDQYVSTTFAVLGLGESSQNVTDTVHKRQSKKLVEFSEEQLKPAYQRWLRDGTPITFVMKLPKKQVNGCTVFRSMVSNLNSNSLTRSGPRQSPSSSTTSPSQETCTSSS